LIFVPIGVVASTLFLCAIGKLQHVTGCSCFRLMLCSTSLKRKLMMLMQKLEIVGGCWTGLLPFSTIFFDRWYYIEFATELLFTVMMCAYRMYLDYIIAYRITELKQNWH